MTERKAVYYGQVKLIPGVICDGYVLSDQAAVLSERGTADLLSMDQKTLMAVRGNWPLKTLEAFVDKDLTVRGNYVEVIAKNSPHCGRKIVVYTSDAIECLIRTYALAFINDGLRKNQMHIGKKARETAIIGKYALVRFHHRIGLESLINGILQAKRGSVITLYELELACKC